MASQINNRRIGYDQQNQKQNKIKSEVWEWTTWNEKNQNMIWASLWGEKNQIPTCHIVYKLSRSSYTYYVCTNFLNKFIKIIYKNCSLRFTMGTTLLGKQNVSHHSPVVTAYSILYLLNSFGSWKVKFILASCCRDP